MSVKPFRRSGKYIPTIEDVAELSGVDSLPPGGFPLTHLMGEVTGMTPEKHVLVVSSAQGDQALYYVDTFGVTVTGLDISPSMVDISVRQARERSLCERARFEIGDAQALPYDSNSFDIVVNEGAVGIPPQPVEVLKEMVRVARVGAPICLRESIWAADLSDAEKAELSERYGTSPLTAEEWVALLSELGVADVTCETQPWSDPQQFWQVRKDREVDGYDDIYTRSEKLQVGKRIYNQYGMEGIKRVKENEAVFYEAVKAGKIGYALFYGVKR